MTFAAANGARSADDEKMLVGTNTGKAGLFNVTGAENQRMTINLPGSTTLTGASGDPMKVDNFTSDKGTELTLDGTSGTFLVGADMTVNQGQDEGDYTGTYQVTVSY